MPAATVRSSQYTARSVTVSPPRRTGMARVPLHPVRLHPDGCTHGYRRRCAPLAPTHRRSVEPAGSSCSSTWRSPVRSASSPGRSKITRAWATWPGS